MTRTPDEIKKGLEYLSITNVAQKVEAAKKGLQYVYTEEVAADAIAYIQQLEAKNAELLEKVEKLKTERDAAVKDIRLSITSYVGGCRTCKHGKNQVDCDEPVLCLMCNVKDYLCRTCGENQRNWEWRGVQKEDSDA